MPLPAVLSAESLATLPEAIRSQYVPEGDQFRLDVTPAAGFELAAVALLKSALQKERDAIKELKQKQKALETQYEGLDPVKAREALGKLDEIASWDPERKLKEHKQHFEQQTAQRYEVESKKLTEKFTSQLTAREQEARALQAQLESHLIGSSATKAITEARGAVSLLLPIVKAKTKVIKTEDGHFNAVVLDDAGQVRLSPKASSTAHMTVDELVAELRGMPEFERAFEGTGSSGGGGGSGGNRSPGSTGYSNPFAAATLNLTEQARLIKENPALAERLRVMAGAR